MDAMPKRSITEAAVWVADRLEHLGFRVNPSSRFGELRRLARAPEGIDFVPVSDPRFWPLYHSVRDLLQMEFVLHHLWREGVPPAQRDRQNRLVQDHAVPSIDHKKTMGRDLQFELTIEAKLVAGGGSAVWDEATDVRCEFDGRPFGVACKRARSERALVDAVAAASEQIAESGHPGVGVIDLSLCVNPEFAALTSGSVHGDGRRLYAEACAALARVEQRVRRVVDQERVARLYFFTESIRYAGAGAFDLCSMFVRLRLDRGEVLRRRLLAAFDKALVAGTPNFSDVPDPNRRRL
jgi:hypothetical protein